MTEEEIKTHIDSSLQTSTHKYMGRVSYNGELYHTATTSNQALARYYRRKLISALKHITKCSTNNFTHLPSYIEALEFVTEHKQILPISDNVYTFDK